MEEYNEKDASNYTQHAYRHEYTNRWINRCNYCQHEYEEMFNYSCPECFFHCDDCHADIERDEDGDAFHFNCSARPDEWD